MDVVGDAKEKDEYQTQENKFFFPGQVHDRQRQQQEEADKKRFEDDIEKSESADEKDLKNEGQEKEVENQELAEREG
jgi:hypothetical protein